MSMRIPAFREIIDNVFPHDVMGRGGGGSLSVTYDEQVAITDSRPEDQPGDPVSERR